jgi:hypothetical protein
MNAPHPNTKIEVLLVEDSIEEVCLMSSFLDKSGLFQITTS